MSVAKMKDGRWYVYLRYKNYSGTIKQHKKTGFKTKREAQEYEQSYRRKVEGSPDMTLGELYENYINARANIVKRSSLISYKSIYKCLIEPAFKNTPITDINPQSVMQWQNELINQSFSSSYISSGKMVLSSILSHAVKYYSLQSNPVTSSDRIKHHKKDMQYWTLQEFNKALPYMKEPYSTMARILYWTGMRKGELLALTPDDIDLDSRTITISKTLYKGKIQTPKTKKSARKILLTKETNELLRTYINRMYDKELPLFSDYDSQVLRTQLNLASDKAGIPKIRIHDLRHSHASLLIELGVPPLAVSERLGHDNVQTTLTIYAHLYPNKQEEIIAKLENI